MSNNDAFINSLIGTMKVIVGTPGNVRTVTMDGSRAWNVAEILNLAEINPAGYDVRVNGVPSNAETVVTDGQRIMLLAPVRGNNFDEEARANLEPTIGEVTPVLRNESMKVIVGTPGNVRTITLDAGRPWSVSEVLAYADIPSAGYDIRVNGVPSTGDSPVTDGQRVMLLAPVRGN